MTTATYLPPGATRGALDPSYTRTFNAHSWPKVTPYVVAGALAVSSAGGAIIDKVVTAHDQSPAAKVRLLKPSTGASMMHLPVQSIQHNYAGGTTSAHHDGSDSVRFTFEK